MAPDWPNHLTPPERARLKQIEAGLSAYNAERRKLMNRAKQRRHRLQGSAG